MKLAVLILVPVLILLTSCTIHVEAPAPTCPTGFEPCGIAIAADGGFENVSPSIPPTAS